MVLSPSLENIFASALEKGPEERGAYLDEACRDQPALRKQVERMLAAHAHAGEFLESPAPELDATDAHAANERPGDTIGRYKLLEEIAEGGMGVVYMAEQREPVRRKVALKIVKPGMDTREVIARFEAERQALAMMDHPNIAKVFDAGETESGRSYFVMELVRGMPLTEYCDKNELTIHQRLELFVQVCQTVHHAHQKGIIHRDVKPSNVMVTHRDGTPVPKVIDFGIAKALHGAPLTGRTLFTRYGQMIGTPLYMSPEQTEMSDLDVDTRSDIYSLGVVLYELLTGTTPFDQERVKKANYDEVRRMIREDEPPPPSTRVSTLKAEETAVFSQRKTDPLRLGSLLRRDLDWIVMKALEKDRARRYDTASDLARDVERYLAGQPVTAAPPSTRYRLGKWARRHRKLVSTVAVFLIGGAAAAGVMLAAMLIVRTRDPSGRETTVETSQPSTVNISKDGSVSIVPVRENEKPRAAASPTQPADGPALKDFFNGVPGRWVPVLRSEKDLAAAPVFATVAPRGTKGIQFQSGAVVFEATRIALPAFKGAVQGIRARVKCDSGQGCLLLRTRSDGSSCNAIFGAGGEMARGANVSVSVNRFLKWVPGPYNGPSWEPTASFFPVGFAAIGDLFVTELKGKRRSYLNDQIAFGAPGLGTKLDTGSRVSFKDIEVFVPDKDSVAVTPAAAKTLPFRENRLLPKIVVGKWMPLLPPRGQILGWDRSKECARYADIGAEKQDKDWIPLLRSPDQLVGWQASDKVHYVGGAMEIDDRGHAGHQVVAKDMSIRVTAKVAQGSRVTLRLRSGFNGHYSCLFRASNDLDIGKAMPLPGQWARLATWKVHDHGDFVDIQFSATGDRLIAIANGEEAVVATDSTHTAGRILIGGHGSQLFRDIELLIPNEASLLADNRLLRGPFADVNAAEEICTQCLRNEPDNLPLYLQRTYLRARYEQKWPQAAEDLAKAIELNPDDFWSWWKRATLLAKLRQSASLADHLKKMLARFRDDPDPLRKRALALCLAVSPITREDLIRAGEALVKQLPNGSETHFLLAFVCYRGGEFKEAEKLYSAAEIESKSPLAAGGAGYEPPGYYEAFHAMIKAKLNHKDEAKELLAKAKAGVQKQLFDKKLARGDYGEEWWERLRAEAVLDEAERLISSGATARDRPGNQQRRNPASSRSPGPVPGGDVWPQRRTGHAAPPGKHSLHRHKAGWGREGRCGWRRVVSKHPLARHRAGRGETRFAARIPPAAVLFPEKSSHWREGFCGRLSH